MDRREGSPPPPSWDEVLAAFTARTDQAQALLESDLSAPVVAAVVGYDVWQLSMPELPDELREAAQALELRQRELAVKLGDAMLTLRQSLVDGPPELTAPTALAALAARTKPTTPPRAVFVDQRV